MRSALIEQPHPLQDLIDALIGRCGCARRTAPTASRAALASASRRLSATVWLSNTVGLWNFRPMPSRRSAPRRAWSDRSVPSNSASPVSGRVLPVMTSIIVVLPAPFGPMIARISPGSMTKDKLFSALKPSKRHRDTVEIEDVVGLERPCCPSRSLRAPGPTASGSFAAALPSAANCRRHCWIVPTMPFGRNSVTRRTGRRARTASRARACAPVK